MFIRPNAGLAALAFAGAALCASCDGGQLPMEPVPEPSARPLEPSGPFATDGLVVTTVTTGGNFDVDGFKVSVDGGREWPTELNASLAFANVPPGPHTIVLSGLASNCVATAGSQQVASTLPSGPTHVRYDVVCAPSPELAGVRAIFAHASAAMPSGGTRSSLAVLRADQIDVEELTNGRFRDYGPKVAPDGRTIAFMRADPAAANQPEIYLMSALTAGIWRILSGTAYEPEWSPDGGKLLFLTPGAHWGGAIHVARPDGGGATRLMTVSEDEDASPAWSPDGTRIAFTRWSFTGSGLSVWIVNADGTGETPLTGSGPWGPYKPVWSPDGRIAYSASDGFGRTSRIHMMNADGSGVTTLLESEEHVIAHDWSADGRFLMFTRRGDIFLLRLSDRSLFRLTADHRSMDPVFWPGS